MIKQISIKTKIGWISAYETNGKVFKIKFPDYCIKDPEKCIYSAKIGVLRRYFQN